MKSSDIARRMSSGAFWSFTGTALGKFLVLLTGIICARILGKEVFGQLGMIRSTIGMFIVLGTGGIGVTATRFVSSLRQTDPRHAIAIYRLSVLFALVIGVVSALLMFVFSRTLANDILRSPEVMLSFQLGCVMLVVSVLNGPENGALVGMENFRAVAINTFVGSLFESVLMIAGAYYYQLEGAILGFGIGVIALYVANKLSVRNYFKHTGFVIREQHIRREDIPILWKFSIPATLSALTIAPIFWLIRSMLVRADGYDELASFEAADQWKIIILFVPTAISQIALPILSSIADNKKFRQTLLANVALIALTSVVLAAVITLLSPFIMPLYGQSCTDFMPLVLLAISTVPSAVSNVIEMSIYSRDKMWTCFGFNMIWAALVVGLSYVFLMMDMGASGLALSILIAYLLKTAYMAIYIRHLMNTKVINP